MVWYGSAYASASASANIYNITMTKMHTKSDHDPTLRAIIII